MPDRGPPSSHRLQVLFVDDDPEILMALEECVRAVADVEVRTATSGEQGLAVLSESPVDLMICDYRMPGADGAAILRRAQVIRPTAKLLCLSGNPDRYLVESLSKIGIGVLSKPVQPEVLAGIVRSLARSKAAKANPG